MKPLTKQLLAAYICWEMLHLIFLVAGNRFFGSVDMNFFLGRIDDDFWPLDHSSLSCYDITEFIIYSTLPIAVYWVIRLVKESLPPTRG